MNEKKKTKFICKLWSIFSEVQANSISAESALIDLIYEMITFIESIDKEED